MTMRLAFWVSFALVGYAYLGYPLCLYLFCRPRAVRHKPITPSVSVLIAARNEQARLPAKLANLRALDYPRELTQIVLVSDGSTDRTAQILAEQAPGILAILRPVSAGKAVALNEAVRHATGEILVFLDVRQSLDPDAIRALVSPFADPDVGAVSGELVLDPAAGGHSAAGVQTSDGVGLYWKIEKAVRRLESASGSVIGVTGAIYALRRELYTPIPPGTLLDDVFIPMHVIRSGKRVLFEPRAIARDRIFAEPGKEFARKVRTLTGNYQLARLAPWLLSPANPALFRFVSHKLARLTVPFLLVLMLGASARAGGPFYRDLFYLQALFYLAATLGAILPAARRLKPIAIASTFVMLNAAAAVAFYNFLTGRTEVWF